jgi:hypothetical protein
VALTKVASKNLGKLKRMEAARTGRRYLKSRRLMAPASFIDWL